MYLKSVIQKFQTSKNKIH